MKRTSRIFLQALPLLAVATACGSSSSTSGHPSSTVSGHAPTSAAGSGPTPSAASARPVIRVAGASPTTGGAETRSAVDSKMRVAPGSVLYRFDGPFPIFPKTGPSWSMPAHQGVDEALVARIAAAFGATGPVKRLPADQGGGWQVGTQDGTTANLTVVDDGTLAWYFNPAMTAAAPNISCSDPGLADSVVAETAPSVECPPPSPPVGVPTEDDALAKAKQLLDAAGIDLAGQTLDATADEWSASVSATLELAGHRTSMMTQIFFGGAGAITAASGFLATPVAGADYPIVTPVQAVQRLNDRASDWMTPLGDPRIAAAQGPAVRIDQAAGCGPTVEAVTVAGDPSTTAGQAPAPTPEPARAPQTAAAPAPAPTPEPARAPETTAGPIPAPTVSAGSGTGSAASSIPPVPSDPQTCQQGEGGASGSGAPAPGGQGGGSEATAAASTVAPIVVTLTAVGLDIDPLYASDGTVWLVPTFVFTSADGGEYRVAAVTDEYLQHDIG